MEAYWIPAASGFWLGILTSISPCPLATNLAAQGMSFFERYLTIWVALCIVGGIVLGKLAPGLARSLDAMAIFGRWRAGDLDSDCPVPVLHDVSHHGEDRLRRGLAGRPRVQARGTDPVHQLGHQAVHDVRHCRVVPRIAAVAADRARCGRLCEAAVGDIAGGRRSYGAGTVVLQDGVKMLEVPLWRSYLAGCILLGVAPAPRWFLVWSYLARGNVGHTLIMVAINSLTMLVLYGVIGGFLLGVGQLPVPWQALLLSIGVYVALPLVAGYFSRKWILAAKGEIWFREKFLHLLTPVTIGACS
jgi:arsenite transporter